MVLSKRYKTVQKDYTFYSDGRGKEYSRQELSELFGLKIYAVDRMLCKAGKCGESFDLFDKYQIKVVDIKKGQSTIEKHQELVN